MAITDFFKRKETRMLKSEFVKMVVGYQPAFSTYSGGVYEMDMTVAAIHSFANHCSKANPKVKGSSYKNIEKQFQVFMNDTMTTSQFLYRVATIYKCENNVYIIPIYDQYQFITGWYPISTIGSRIESINNVLMLTYTLSSKQYAIPYSEVIHLKSHHYDKELMGNGNNPLYSTLSLIDTQNQGIVNGIQQSNTIRFIAKLNNIFNPKDMKDERLRLIEDNLSNTNTGGVLIFDKKYEDIKQVESKPFIVDAEQAEYIRNNVYNYFGTNEKILQNKFNEAEWGAYYEGEIEPLLIQLSQGMTRCMFTSREISFDNFILWEATRLQYASTDTKLSLYTQLFDRGTLTQNEGRNILNLPLIDDENADKFYIRLEYTEVGQLNSKQGNEEPQKVDETDVVTDEKLVVLPEVSEDNTIAQVSLNGAQIQGLLSIVQSVIDGVLEYDSAVALIVSSFPFDEAMAKKILGSPDKLKKKLDEQKEVQDDNKG